MWRILAKIIMKLAGWKVAYPIPDESQRCVIIAAPHTTNWDAIWTRIAFAELGIPVKIAIKDTWTKIPIIGLFIRAVGGLGISRKPKKAGQPRKSQIEQMADFFGSYERIAMVIAPEGSRSLKKEWKMGFYHVAKKANVPIAYGYLDYVKKEAGVGGALHLSEDLEADMAKIMAFYKDISPKFPEQFSLDQRYTKGVMSDE